MSLAFGSARVTLGSTELTNASGVSYARNETVSTVGDDGNMHAATNLVLTASPQIQFTCGDLGKLLGGNPVLLVDPLLKSTNGIPYHSGNCSFVVPRSAAGAPGFYAGSTHAKIAMATAVTLLSSLSWSRGSMATASLASFGLGGTGATDPAVASNVAAPAQLTAQPVWVMTSCSINGVTCPAVSVTITIDHKQTNRDQRCFNDGLPFPVVCLGAGTLGLAEVSCAIETPDMTTRFANGDVVMVFANKAQNGIGLGIETLTVTLNGSMQSQDDAWSIGAPSGRTINIRASYDGALPFTAVYDDGVL